MCTVTFIPLKDKMIITSNRDEKHYRKQALPPAKYTSGEQTIIYPKDADAGGTWIAMKENGNAAVLLNGAFIKHISLPPYKKSRGLVLAELMEASSPVRKFLRTDLSLIEPFTLIVIDNNCLHECRWDGSKTHCKQLPMHRPYIWSSATLYSNNIIKKREQWFAKWLNNNPVPTQKEVLQFHLFGGENDQHNNLRMNRNGFIYTVSVTSIELTDDAAGMYYLDLEDHSLHHQAIKFLSSCVV